MKLNRKVAKLSQMRNISDDDYVDASMKDRLEMVWDITIELWSISTKGDMRVKPRLQRDVANFKRT
jgi:hypothetical protein